MKIIGYLCMMMLLPAFLKGQEAPKNGSGKDSCAICDKSCEPEDATGVKKNNFEKTKIRFSMSQRRRSYMLPDTEMYYAHVRRDPKTSPITVPVQVRHSGSPASPSSSPVAILVSGREEEKI